MSSITVDNMHSAYDDFLNEAHEYAEFAGKTPLYAFQDNILNEKFGGGISKPNFSNIILISGGSGVGKTLLTLNIITSAIKEGAKICHLLLEDDPGAAVYNLIKMNGEEVIKNYRDKNYFLGPDKMKDQYSKEDALVFIEGALKAGFDLVVIDHIQFMFEATATQKDEWMQQRVFIRQLNRIVKHHKKTVVIVSHTNKTAAATNYSLDSTTGSNSIGQVATKALMIYRDDKKILRLKQEKSRYTKPCFEEIPIKFDKNLIVRYDREIDDGKLEELL